MTQALSAACHPARLREHLVLTWRVTLQLWAATAPVAVRMLLSLHSEQHLHLIKTAVAAPPLTSALTPRSTLRFPSVARRCFAPQTAPSSIVAGKLSLSPFVAEFPQRFCSAKPQRVHGSASQHTQLLAPALLVSSPAHSQALCALHEAVTVHLLIVALSPTPCRKQLLNQDPALTPPCLTQLIGIDHPRCAKCQHQD
eukprot:CAMPEP_0172684718 /NCGR_PEP_ID=MMETSP1074-20121228/19758_1 /TAXON_ID=2916 /ORGANISM="Ceratium fusus, Strain PA161109" /LENGTH=197 /DNA_ID=CAMNT_0013503777 /DNA_START=481 /DNA_END=1074 /DNA_ORIENTATION=+